MFNFADERLVVEGGYGTVMQSVYFWDDRIDKTRHLNPLPWALETSLFW